MNDDEYELNCNGSSNSSEIQLLYHSNVEFKSNVSWRGFTGNCLYYDPITSTWKSDGVEMLSDTNHQFTHW